MKTIFENSAFFGVMLSLTSYGIGTILKKRFHIGIFNPLLISIIISIIVISLFHIDYDHYYEGAKYLSYLLTPATVCLAIPLYEQFSLLQKNSMAIIAGIVAGVFTSLGCIFGMALLFRFSHEEYVTLLPKSITTAIGIGVSEELGGYVSITAIVIVVTGVLGNVIAEGIFRLFKITDPIAKGVSLGTASHAIGTSKALEIGDIEGAMSSLSIVISGLLTVIFASIFAEFI